MVSRGSLVVVLLVLLAVPASAEEPKKPDVPHGNFLAALEAVKDGVRHFGPAPKDSGIYDKHQETWKRYAKPRTRRMLGRIKLLSKPKLWGVEEGPDAAAGAKSLAPNSWSALVKSIASLYSELGTVRSRYAEQRVNNRYARKLWLHRNPGPDPIERVPSRDALDAIGVSIAEYRYAGLVVPVRLLSAHRRLSSTVAAEEAEARARKRAEYDARKHKAYAGIDAYVAATMASLRADVDQLAAQQRALREIVAAAQEIEERRLKAIVAKAPKEGGHLDGIGDIFRKLERGRRQGLNFSDSRSSRWGSLVRQKWMTQRSKVLSLVKKAERAAAEAAKIKNEEPPKKAAEAAGK